MSLEGGWEKWCKAHITQRTMRDIRKVMKLAGADDPEVAAAAEREKVRVQVARSRASEAPGIRMAGPADSGHPTRTSEEQPSEPTPTGVTQRQALLLKIAAIISDELADEVIDLLDGWFTEDNPLRASDDDGTQNYAEMQRRTEQDSAVRRMIEQAGAR